MPGGSFLRMCSDIRNPAVGTRFQRLISGPSVEVTDEQVLAKSTCTMRDPKNPRQVRVMPSPMTAQRIHRCLAELKGLAEWANANRHLRIEATIAAA